MQQELTESKVPKTGNFANNYRNKRVVTSNQLSMTDENGSRTVLSNFWARIVCQEPGGIYAIMGRDAEDKAFLARMSAAEFWDGQTLAMTLRAKRGPLAAIVDGHEHDVAAAIAQLTNESRRMSSPLFQ